MANHAAVVVYYSTTWFTLRSNIGLHIFKGKICTNLSVFEVNPFRDIKNRFMKFNNGLTVRRNTVSSQCEVFVSGSKTVTFSRRKIWFWLQSTLNRPLRVKPMNKTRSRKWNLYEYFFASWYVIQHNPSLFSHAVGVFTAFSHLPLVKTI